MVLDQREAVGADVNTLFAVEWIEMNELPGKS